MKERHGARGNEHGVPEVESVPFEKKKWENVKL